MRGAVSTFTSSNVYGVDAKPLYSGFFSSFPLAMHKLHICVYTCTRGQTDAHIHHSLCKVLHIVYQVFNFKTQKILVKIFYILFYQTCQTPLHAFGCGCGYLQMTHHRWPGSPGMQGWTMQGGAGGPFLHKEAFLRLPLTLKMPVPKHLPLAKSNQTLIFQNPVSGFEARSE